MPCFARQACLHSPWHVSFKYAAFSYVLTTGGLVIKSGISTIAHLFHPLGWLFLKEVLPFISVAREQKIVQTLQICH